jgi:hypothetical protein
MTDSEQRWDEPNTRARVVAAFTGLHAVAALLGCILAVGQALVFTLAGADVSLFDLALFGGGFGGASIVLAIASIKSWRAGELWTRAVAGVCVVIGLALMVLGVATVVVGLTGPADVYVVPVGGLLVVVGSVYSAVGAIVWWPVVRP